MIGFCKRVSFAAWKFVKLMEVTVSNDPQEAKAPSHVVLVRGGFVELSNAFEILLDYCILCCK